MNETFYIHAFSGLGGYLLGSIPFGVIISRLFGLGNLRQVGSGNIGATNVLRTGNKLAAALTLLLDGAKGAVAVALAVMIYGESTFAGLAAGFWVVMGHNFPVWLKFKGGKGVATSIGVLLVVVWPAGVAAIVAWLATAAVFRYSSLAALVGLTIAPAVAFFAIGWQQAFMGGLLAVSAWIRHRQNVLRLMRGEEDKIGAPKST